MTRGIGLSLFLLEHVILILFLCKVLQAPPIYFEVQTVVCKMCEWNFVKIKI